MRAFGAAIREAFRRIFADRAAVTTLIGAAVLYSFYYPSPYREERASHLSIVIVDLDRSSMSRDLVRKVLAVRAVLPAASVESLEEARELVARGDAHGILFITADFQREVLRGHQGRVALFGNGAFLGHGSTALGGLSEAVAAIGRDAALVQAQFAGRGAGPALQLVQRPLFNTREGYGSTVVPAVAILIVQQTLLLGIGLMVGTVRERGGRMTLAGPGLLGVIVAFGAIGVVNLLYYSGFVFWFQDFPRGGNLAGLLIAGGLFVAAVVPLGLLVGSVFPTRERAFQVLSLLSLPMFFLANLSWPKDASPVALTWLAKLLPTTAGINAMVKFNQMGAHLSEASAEIWNLALLALLYGCATAWRYAPTALSQTRAAL